MAAKELARQLAAFPQRCLRSGRVSACDGWTLPFDDALHNKYRHGKATIDSGQKRAGRRALPSAPAATVSSNAMKR